MTKSQRYAPHLRRTFDPKKRWISNHGTVLFRGRKLRPYKTDLGYIRFRVNDTSYYLSRLVLTAFDRPPEPGEQADHRERNTDDNRLVALRWLSCGQNNQASHDLNEDRKSNSELVSLRILCFPVDPRTKERLPGPPVLFPSMINAAQRLEAEKRRISDSVNKGIIDKQWIFELAPDPDLPEEIWEAVPGMGGFLVSNKQRYKHPAANKVNLGPGRHRVKVNKTDFYFHRLVHLAFIGPIPEGYEVDHIDEKTKSNEPHLLQAVTPSQNIKLSHKRGIRKTADTNRSVIAIDKLGNQREFASIKEAAEQLKLHAQNITGILNGKRKTASGYTFRRNDLFDMDVDAAEGEEFIELTDEILQLSRYIRPEAGRE